MRVLIFLGLILLCSELLFAEADGLKNRGLNQEEIDQLYEIMGVTDIIFTKNNINYRLEGGSLLGAVRHGGFIPWDDDGDFDVLEEDLPKIKLLAPEFAKVGMEIIDVPGWGLQVFYKNSPELPLTDWNGLKSKKPFLDLIALKNIKVSDWKNDIRILKKQIVLDKKNNKTTLNAKLKNLEQELEYINKNLNNNDSVYVCAQKTSFHDYPTYYLTQEEWTGPIKVIRFGDLVLSSFSNPKNYLDRNYLDWDKKVEILMDHDSNEYFDKPITSKILSHEHKKHSNPAKLDELLLSVLDQ